jgi:phosphatidate cytidylyltransferase
VSEPEQSRQKFNPLAPRSWTDLGPRLMSAAVLIVATVVALYLGGYVFAAFVGAVFAGCYREWERMVTLRPLTTMGGILVAALAVAALIYPALGPLASLAVVAVACVVALLARGEGAAWRAGGLAFFGLVIVAVLAVRGTGEMGIFAGIFLGSVVWLTDTGAYFTGRQVGGEKLAPDISPSKTWSGALGGFALGTLVGLVLWLIMVPASPWWIGLVLAAAISVAGQFGDLVESAIKRRFRVKDSGDIIPGHGGLMDRLDSIIFPMLLAFVVGALHGGMDNVAAGLLLW